MDSTQPRWQSKRYYRSGPDYYGTAFQRDDDVDRLLAQAARATQQAVEKAVWNRTCLPYRLAAENVRLAAQVAAVQALAEMYATGKWTVNDPPALGRNFLAVLDDPAFMTGVTP